MLLFIRKPFVRALILFAFIIFILFWKTFTRGLLPIPGDILIGTYYPWLNYKWGYEVAVPVKNPLMSDVVSLMYPWRKEAIDFIKARELPLWNPGSYFGESLIGNLQTGIFNPFNLLFLLPVSFNIAWSMQVMIQPFLGMVSMYLMLRNWRVSQHAALLGGVSYGLSGQMLVWMEYNLLGFSFAVFPLFILVIDKYIAQKKLSKIIPLSLMVAFVIFAGYVQLLYYFLLFGFWYLILNIFSEKSGWGKLLKSLIYFLAAVLIGLLISSVQLLPGIETLLPSVRNFDVVASTNEVTYLPLKNLLTVIIPDYLGNAATYNYFGEGGYESFVFYTSIVSLICAVWAFKNNDYRKKVCILTILLFLSFGLAVKNPLSELTQTLGFLGLKGSVTSRVLFIYGFCISALAAIGLDHLRVRVKIEKKDFLIVGILAGLFLGTLISYYTISFTVSGKSYASFLAVHLNYLNISVRNSLWPIIIAGFTFLVILIRPRFRLLGYALIILLCVDMFRFGWKYLPFIDSDSVFPKTASLEFLTKQQKPFRIAIEKGEVLTANTWAVYGLESVSGYNILVPKDTADFISLINFKETNKENARFLDIKDFDSKLLDLVNAKYVVSILRKTGSPSGDGELAYFIDENKYEPVYKEGPLQILKNKNYLERFFTVKDYKVIADKNLSYKYLSGSDFEPSTELVLEREPFLKGPFGLCDIKLAGYQGQSYQFNSKCQNNSLLFISSAYHEGWKAVINGREGEIIKADGNFMAVVLPEGNSDIVLKFMPKSFIYGAILSLIGILAFCGIMLKDRVLKR